MGRAAGNYLDIRLNGKKLNQGDSFLLLGGAVCGDGGKETGIRRRLQAGASAWRKVEWVTHISKAKRKGFQLMPNTSIPIWPRDHGDDRKTTRETASLRE